MGLKEFDFVDTWLNRPASDWSLKRISILQSKIEKYTYKLYNMNKFGRQNLSKLVPTHLILQFANESFGFNGWSSEIVSFSITDIKVANPSNDNNSTINSKDKVSHTNKIMGQESTINDCANEDQVMITVFAESKIIVTLKDGTKTDSIGFGTGTMSSKGLALAKAKKESVSNGLKWAFLNFKNLLDEHEIKIKSKFYKDGLYGTVSR
ncbi:related to DNA repair protein RAD59 [Saccharomycodes ludwigii]|uniref:Related to DNA repair protein RAD59 n=2 Tax=Saccharomycodes ludwigii TaxID=36035 RepID=A0A376B119_9ASCO|nr:related to DNA repair protein RAD59 [Saccharomycodes ludwigii]